MNIAVIGAAGSVGRVLAQTIVSERSLSCQERLVLVGNAEGESAKSMPGFAVDLMDGFGEITPKIEVTFDLSCLDVDLIVMAAGLTLPTGSGQTLSRDALAETNFPMFDHYARQLETCSRGHEIVLCISNPNELCVMTFARYLGRKRVMGMGAFLDSLRFRQEIARDLGIRRQVIHGFMVGEHGANVVPLWSSVHIHGFAEDHLAESLHKIRRGYETENFFTDIQEALDPLKSLVLAGKVQKAFEHIDRFPPDIRAFLKPFVTHFSGARTVTGTARAAMDFIRAITSGNDALISGQVVLDREFHGITSTLGVPFVIGNRGVERIIELAISDDEKTLLDRCARQVNEKFQKYQNILEKEAEG